MSFRESSIAQKCPNHKNSDAATVEAAAVVSQLGILYSDLRPQRSTDIRKGNTVFFRPCAKFLVFHGFPGFLHVCLPDSTPWRFPSK